MEPKKNPELDLNKDRGLFRVIGFVFVFALALIMFSFTTFQKRKAKEKPKKGSADAQSVVQTVQQKPQPKTPPPPTTVIEKVENNQIETDFYIPDFDDELPDFQDINFGSDKGEPDIKETIFDPSAVEEEAAFKGGEEAFYAFLENELKYPESARANLLEGIVIVTYVVDKNGKVTNVTTDGTMPKELEEEAKRVIERTSGMWEAAKYKKKAVSTLCKIPIEFGLDDDY